MFAGQVGDWCVERRYNCIASWSIGWGLCHKSSPRRFCFNIFHPFDITCNIVSLPALAMVALPVYTPFVFVPLGDGPAGLTSPIKGSRR
ncbi:hypothetical protein BDR03DRAFT_955471 [Suillus americanus]|nr:hypothetical protein BDR03DRAFT_955471 [Suillus americanus]